MQKVYPLSFGIANKIRHLPVFLELPLCDSLREASHVLGWGYKTTGRKALETAARLGLKPLIVEDGFLAVAPGMDLATQRLALVVDEHCAYFDTSRKSQLESLLCDMRDDASEAGPLIARWKVLRASKYSPSDTPSPLPREVDDAFRQGREVVVLLDQIAEDASLAPEFTGDKPFERMVEQARADHPNALFVIKQHPRAGERARFKRKRGALQPTRMPEAVLCPGSVPMGELCAKAAHVYTVTSHAGFEALLWGVKVTCIGHPWYAGWGATQDCYTPPNRACLPRRTVNQLFVAAYARYSRYVHPATGRRMTLEDALSHLELQNKVRQQTPPKVAVVDCQYWKRSYYRDFFPGATVTYVRQKDIGSKVNRSWTLVTWGQRVEQRVVDDWRRHGFKVLQSEDGFLRSVGLGCEMVRPLSLCFDSTGLYADPRTDSHLLELIQQPLSPAQARDTRRFLTMHRNLRLSKYLLRGPREAIAAPTADALAAVGDRPVLLLCGQVGDDVSLLASGCLFATFERLAQEIRRQRPDAFIIYRPHPDVVRGLRPGEMSLPSADLNDIQTPTRALAEAVHEVHVVNSLAGFESLLLGKPVHTWGRGWYAGWGLTQDHLQEPRSAQATLHQLAHAAYLQHPLYFEPHSRQFISPCSAAEVLAKQREAEAPKKSWADRMSRWLPRRLIRWVSAKVQDLEQARLFP